MIKIYKDGQWVEVGGGSGGGSSPSEYLKNAEVIDDATLRIEKKDGTLVDFTPTVSGGITREEVVTMVETEKSEREAADTTISGNLTDETKNRITGDDTLSQALTAETNARTEADETLQTNIDNEASARQTADNGKVSIMEGAGVYANYVEGETTEQILEPYSSDVQDSAIVKRYGEQIKVPTTPNNDDEAASKAYVDSHSAEGIINDGTASASSTYSSNKINTLVSGIVNIDVVTEQPTSPADNTMYYIGTENPYTVKLHTTGSNWYEMGSTTIDLTPYFKTANIANDLTTTDSGKALDARQGKVLNTSISTVSSQLSQWEKQLTTTTATANAAKAGLTDGSVTKVGTATVGGTLQGVYLKSGVPTVTTQLYNKNMTVNGTAYSHLRTANNNSFSIYAPTATGSQGQVLTSYGSGTPKWNDMFVKIRDDAISERGTFSFTESIKHFDMLCFVYKLTDAGVYGCAWFPVFDLFTDSTRVWEISHGYDDDDHTMRFKIPNELTITITDYDELSIRGIYGMFRCADKA